MISLGLALGSLGLYVMLVAGRAWLAVRCAAGQSRPGSRESPGPVTVLTPILGGDPGLTETLRTNVALADADARFVWLVDDDDPVGQAAAEAAASARPDAVTLRPCPPPPQHVNPKLFKLAAGMACVDTPYIAVLDDDTRLEPGVLGFAADALEHCDLYTGLPCYARGNTCWSSLVAHFVNNNAITTYLPLLHVMPPITINGMFYVIRRDTLERLGGFAAVQDQLCDDYAIAKLVRDARGVIEQGVTIQRLATHVPNLWRYLALMRRWFLFADHLVRDQPVGPRVAIVTMLALPPLLLWLGVVAAITACVAGQVAASLAVLGAALVLRHGLIRWTHVAVYRAPCDFGAAHSLVAELLQPVFGVMAMVGPRTLSWRSRRIRLLRDGRFAYDVPDEPRSLPE